MTDREHEPTDVDARLARALGPFPQTAPSAGFAETVMRSVRAEADPGRVPSPIAFPWRRAVPAFALLFALTGIALSSLPWGDAAGGASAPVLREVERVAAAPETASAALAVAWLGFAFLLAFAALRVAGWSAARGGPSAVRHDTGMSA